MFAFIICPDSFVSKRYFYVARDIFLIRVIQAGSSLVILMFHLNLYYFEYKKEPISKPFKLFIKLLQVSRTHDFI